MARNLIIYTFIFLSLLSVVMGCALVVLKPPSDTAHHYLAMAHHYLDVAAQDTSPDAALALTQGVTALTHAARFQPYSADIWQALHLAHAQQGDITTTQNIAAILHFLDKQSETLFQPEERKMTALSFKLAPAATIPAQ